MWRQHPVSGYHGTKQPDLSNATSRCKCSYAHGATLRTDLSNATHTAQRYAHGVTLRTDCVTPRTDLRTGPGLAYTPTTAGRGVVQGKAGTRSVIFRSGKYMAVSGGVKCWFSPLIVSQSDSLIMTFIPIVSGGSHVRFLYLYHLKYVFVQL